MALWPPKPRELVRAACTFEALAAAWYNGSKEKRIPGNSGTEGQMQQRSGVVEADPDILGGTPVFAGTRVPVQILIEYLEGGDRLDDFLDDFPTVSRAQEVAALEIVRDTLIAHARPPR